MKNFLNYSCCISFSPYRFSTIIFLFLILFNLSFSNLFAQNPEWIIYNGFGRFIRALAFEEDYVWVCTDGGGIVKFNPINRKYVVFNIGKLIYYNSAYTISIDNVDKWIGTEKGLIKFDGVNWTVYNRSNSALPSNFVRAIAIDKSGNKWIGTDGWFGASPGGFVKFDGVNWTVFNTTNLDFTNDGITSIAIDSSGNIWLGTYFKGLIKFDGVNWTIYNTSNSGLPKNWVNAVAIDNSGNIWIGTDGGGLAKFDGVNWTVYNTTNSGLPDNLITSIAIDSSGNKWIGTFLGGLAKFDGVNWTVYNTSNSGLPHNLIWAIAIDALGNKWIGTDGKGLAVYREGGVIFTDVNENKNQIVPLNYLLSHNYPNPFNPTTKIKYAVPKTSLVTLKIYDTLGREISTLVNEEKTPGNYEVEFNAADLPSGVYFYRMQAGNFSETKKMVLMR